MASIPTSVSIKIPRFFKSQNLCQIIYRHFNCVFQTHIRHRESEIRSKLCQRARDASTCSGFGPVACKVYCTPHTHLLAHHAHKRTVPLRRCRLHPAPPPPAPHSTPNLSCASSSDVDRQIFCLLWDKMSARAEELGRGRSFAHL